MKFLSTWRGDVFLNTHTDRYTDDDEALIKNVKKRFLLKLVPTKNGKDLFEGPEEDTV